MLLTPVPLKNMNNQLGDRNPPIQGEIWKHYKGKQYRIVDTAIQESDGLTVVVYKSIENPQTFVRPLSEFMEHLGDCYRFEKLEDRQLTDLEMFINLYNRFGIKLNIEAYYGHYLVILPCSSMAEFDENGKFISQELVG